ncbi:DUF1775 domain-containing protein [Microbacterium sp. NPDC019599]|uniref:DUF1775 domain-containing protein n=1 Tax=Microbacterium sp. NPDC019599 TaxID=3154690 RepID=UPI0033C6DF96
MNSTTTRPARRLALLAGGGVAGLALAVAAPLAASAHVHVSPETAPAGASQTLAFTFSHGCDGSPTSAVVIDIPDAVAATTPVAQGGWTIARELGEDEQPTRVTFTSDTPIESGVQASVELVVTFSEGAAGTTAAFPVTQECVEGETAWVEVAADGEDPESLEAPAPVVAVGEVAADAHGHGSSAGAADDGAHDAASDAAADAHDDAAAPAPTADPVARWLAGGALAVAVATLVVVLARLRRKA